MAEKDILDETSEAEEEEEKTDDVEEASNPNLDNLEEMWKHFIRNKSKGTAKCKFCSNILICSRPQNLSVHLKNKHQVELNKIGNNSQKEEEVTAASKVDHKNIASEKKATISDNSSKTSEIHTPKIPETPQVPDNDGFEDITLGSDFRSVVWSHFLLNKSLQRIKCKKCSYNSSRKQCTTTLLSKHMLKEHSIDAKIASKDSNQKSVTSSNQNKVSKKSRFGGENL